MTQHKAFEKSDTSETEIQMRKNYMSERAHALQTVETFTEKHCNVHK